MELDLQTIKNIRDRVQKSIDKNTDLIDVIYYDLRDGNLEDRKKLVEILLTAESQLKELKDYLKERI